MKIFKYLVVTALIVLSYSCKKLTTEGVSKITNYVVLTLQGDQIMTVAQGTAFTDPGVTAMEGDVPAEVTTTGAVDTNTPGTYTLTYTSLNAQGYSASTYRIVGVYDVAAAANNLSGNYARSTNGSVAVWTKVGTALYTVFNPGGAPGTNVTVYAFNTAGNIINVPAQNTSVGEMYCTNSTGGPNITYNPGPPAQYKWVVKNAGYGTSLRTFNKQ